MANPFRYHGYYYDTETKLYYQDGEYYNPDLAQFIDSSESNSGIDAVSANLFAYCSNNPVMFTDETGHKLLNENATVHVHSWSYLAVRASASDKAREIGKIFNNERVEIKEYSSYYSYVKYYIKNNTATKQGWVHSRYLEPLVDPNHMAPAYSNSQEPLSGSSMMYIPASSTPSAIRTVLLENAFEAGMNRGITAIFTGGQNLLNNSYKSVTNRFMFYYGVTCGLVYDELQLVLIFVSSEGTAVDVSNRIPRNTNYRSIEDGLNFAYKPAEHMEDPNRFVPVQTLRDAIKYSRSCPDPDGTNYEMHYVRMIRNNRMYNLEVLYDTRTNTIKHFRYTRDAIGYLPAIRK